MVKYNCLALNRIGKETKMEDVPQFADCMIIYGKEEGIDNTWKEILEEKDETLKKEKIISLMTQLESNKDANGFFGKDDEVSIGAGNFFKLDDPTIYAMFFANLSMYSDWAKAQPDKQFADGFIIYSAIKKTTEDYFGKHSDGVRNKRLDLLNGYNANLDDFIVPSISIFRNSGCAECTELAAVSHNLWLLAGKASYFVTSKSVDAPQVSSEYKNDGHSFCICEYGDKFRMCDLAMGITGIIEGNPIEQILNGKNFEFKGVTYYNIEKEMSK